MVEPARVLLVGRIQSSEHVVLVALRKRFQVVVAGSGKEAQQLASEQSFDLVVVDTVSMRTPGARILEGIRQAAPAARLLVLQAKTSGKRSTPPGADAAVFEPINARKVQDAARRLLEHSNHEDVVACGPFVLHRGRQVLTHHGRDLGLTPKQAELIAVFLAHPGETMGRGHLMKKVWQTEYTGDTRTLDVHIRGLRKLIELDPGAPRYLVTVRKVGYRLEVEATAEPVI